ncbi:retrovirus-related pol polyprotein from transposon TNT 1-94 [Tanacetum coccineum]
MSTQQDIYTAGSKNRLLMLNKDNYVPWSSRLLRYAKSKPNGKLIYNSIMHGPYVRRMILEPGDPDRQVSVAETFHEQTDEELTEKEVKQMEADDQAIQTILMGLPEDIYAAVDSCETAQEIWFTSTDGESIESYYHRFSKLMNDFKRNKHFPEKIASNLKFLNNLQPEWRRHAENAGDQNRYNAVQTARNHVVQNALQNPGVQNVGNQNGLIVVPGIANQNVNQNENGNVVASRAEGNGNRNNKNQIRCYNCRGMGHLAWNCIVRPRRRGDLDEIEEVNANCILMAKLQQASTSGTETDKALVYDSDGLTENDSNVISVESSIEHNRGIVEQHPTTVEETLISQDIMSIVQNPTVVETSDLQTELERTKERFENCIIKKENEYAKLWNDWYKKCEECKYNKISYDKANNDMQQKIEQLQAQLGDLKGKSKDTPCVSDTLDHLFQKLEVENVELEFHVLNYAKENAHLKTTYKNLFDSINVTRT